MGVFNLYSQIVLVLPMLLRQIYSVFVISSLTAYSDGGVKIKWQFTANGGGFSLDECIEACNILQFGIGIQ